MAGIPLEFYLMQAVGETPSDPLPNRPLEYYLERIADLPGGSGSVGTASNDFTGVVKGTADPGDGTKDDFVTVVSGGAMKSIGFSGLKSRVDAVKGDLDSETARSEGVEAAIRSELAGVQAGLESRYDLLKDDVDASLPKTDVVVPNGSATEGQAADAAALHTIIAGLVKLASASTQGVFSNLALKTYVDSVTSQTKAFQLLGTAIDGTEHTLIELAEYGAAQQVEIGSETIHLNLNNLGPVGEDNHITCDTHDSTGAAVRLSVAWLSDVVSQCAATLALANTNTDNRVEQLRVDALILQNPCKESELPAGPFVDPSHNGYFYQITNFDVSYPGEDRKGSAVWYDSTNNYYLAVDTYKNADEDTVTENSNGEFMVADVVTGTVVADTSGGFANNVSQGFKAFIAAVVAKINGLFSLIGGLNTAIGLKYTKPSGGIPTSDLALSTGQQNALDSGITSTLVTTFSGKQDALSGDQQAAVNSGITSTLVTSFSGKQEALSVNQLAAVNSGITEDLVAKIGSVGGENGIFSFVFNTEDEYVAARDGIPDGSRVLIIEG